jgi:long-chain acyl-CoA synthetase
MTVSSGESARGEQRGTYLEKHAASMPEAAAIVEDERPLSWAAWNEQANRFADALASRGIGAGDRVAVRTMTRTDWFITDAALAKLGAVRVAVSFRLQASEVRYLLENSQARAIVFDDDSLAAIEPAYRGLDHVSLRIGVSASGAQVERFADVLASGTPRPRLAERSAESIVYTSGTTGRPKGVHKTVPPDPRALALLQRIGDDLRRSIPFERGERNLLCAPLNHAAGPASALGTHVRGGTLFLLRKFEPEEALKLIDRHRIQSSFLVPTMLNRIMSLPPEVRRKYDVSSLRIITTGASVCPADLKRKISAYFGPCLYENYGSTETGLVTMFTPADVEQRADSCGRLLDGVEVRIVDDGGRELPRGEVGQIFIKSAATIGKYYGESGPGSDFTEDGWFTAGDVGKLDEENYLFILDRKKDMIIAGGVNIYPAEIESALCEHPLVRDAAVFGTPHDEWGEQVHAVCERMPGATVEIAQLHSFVAERLASYKRPRAIDVVDELPRNVMGKVLKRELRAPFWEGKGRVI